MTWDQIEGKWKQFKGSAKQHFGKLTDDDLEQIRGKRDVMIGRLQERYGIAKEKARKEADQWFAEAVAMTEAVIPKSLGQTKPGHHAR